MTRITYKAQDGCLVTVNKILCGSDVYAASIDPGTFEFIVVDSEAHVIKRGRSTTLRGAKDSIRNCFKDLGAVIYDEVRTGS